MMRKLLVWDSAWSVYASEFEKRLDGNQWCVRANNGEPAWLTSELPGSSALLALSLPVAALPLAQGLEVFLFPGAGVSDMDSSAYPAGCRVVNVYEHGSPIAEYVLMTMLLHVTQLPAHLEAFRAGEWKGSGRIGGVPHGELAGRTVGLYGNGQIAQSVVARARAFNMDVRAVSRANAAELPGLLQRSEFLVIAAPLTEETRGRFGSAELGMLPAGAFLINVSRAEIVCEQALYEALSSKRLSGAALDVWYRYPRAGERGHGSNLPFHSLSNVICTPHYSAWTLPMIYRRIHRMCENLSRLARGEPLERVVVVGAWRP